MFFLNIYFGACFYRLSIVLFQMKFTDQLTQRFMLNLNCFGAVQHAVCY